MKGASGGEYVKNIEHAGRHNRTRNYVTIDGDNFKMGREFVYLGSSLTVDNREILLCYKYNEIQGRKEFHWDFLHGHYS